MCVDECRSEEKEGSKTGQNPGKVFIVGNCEHFYG